MQVIQLSRTYSATIPFRPLKSRTESRSLWHGRFTHITVKDVSTPFHSLFVLWQRAPQRLRSLATVRTVYRPLTVLSINCLPSLVNRFSKNFFDFFETHFSKQPKTWSAAESLFARIIGRNSQIFEKWAKIGLFHVNFEFTIDQISEY